MVTIITMKMFPAKSELKAGIDSLVAFVCRAEGSVCLRATVRTQLSPRGLFPTSIVGRGLIRWGGLFQHWPVKHVDFETISKLSRLTTLLDSCTRKSVICNSTWQANI